MSNHSCFLRWWTKNPSPLLTQRVAIVNPSQGFHFAGAASPSQFQGMPSHSAIFQQSGSCSPPPNVALSCMGMPQQVQGQPVAIQVQEPGDGMGGSLLQAGRGMPTPVSANQLQMHHRASLMASLTYGHRPLSKQLSADNAESHRYGYGNNGVALGCYVCQFTGGLASTYAECEIPKWCPPWTAVLLSQARPGPFVGSAGADDILLKQVLRKGWVDGQRGS